jgi:phospholipid-binding lipoprotein MlaA
MTHNNIRFGCALIFISAPAILTGCVSTEAMVRQDRDPLEPYNRVMFTFNDKLDKAVLKPVAQGYQAVVPAFLRQRVTDFFNNLGDVSVVVNDLLQFKIQQTLLDTSRLVYNTTFGLGGLFDVSTFLGLPRHDEDFGQTLGRWGVGEGYYLVLPVLGPSTTRDVWGVPVDRVLLNPVFYVQPTSAQWGLTGTDAVNERANLLRLEKAFEEEFQVDPYSFQRQAYLQQRRNLVYDGNPPKPKLEWEENESEAPPAK